MGLSSLAAVRSGLQVPNYFAKVGSASLGGPSYWCTHWAVAGFPAAGAYNSTLNGVTLSNVTTGQIPWIDPNTGNAYVARLEMLGGRAAGGFSGPMLCDRLWHNGGIDVTSTSAQAIATPTWPARDIAGATNGDGVMLALEVSAQVGAATPTITISYTNSAGTSGRTGTNIQATLSTQQLQTANIIGLQAGDTGVKSVESITLSASWISGTINLVAFRPIMLIETFEARTPIAVDPVTGGLPQMFAGSVPYFMSFLTSSNSGWYVQGSLQMAWG